MNKSNKVKKPSVAKVSTKAASSSLKSQEAKRKQVFRPILDNSFTQSNQWPFIEPTIANDIVDLLEVLLKSKTLHLNTMGLIQPCLLLKTSSC